MSAKKLIALVTMLLLAIAITVGTEVSPVKAASITFSEKIGLNLNCSTVPNTINAHAELKKLGLCGYGRGNSIIPNNQISGSCGTLGLDITNNGGGSFHWRAYISSSLGPMFSASYTGGWKNLTKGNSTPVVRSSGIIFTTLYVDGLNFGSGAGTVTAFVNSASDVIALGTCTSEGTVISGTAVS